MALMMALMLAVMLIAGHSAHPDHAGSQAAPTQSPTQYIERADPADAAKGE